MRSFQLEMRTSVLPRLLVALREVFWLFQSWTSRQTHGIYNCQALQQHCLQSKEEELVLSIHFANVCSYHPIASSNNLYLDLCLDMTVV